MLSPYTIWNSNTNKNQAQQWIHPYISKFRNDSENDEYTKLLRGKRWNSARRKLATQNSLIDIKILYATGKLFQYINI